MGIRRGPLPSDHFTIISNDWLRDTSLTFRARGILGWLTSHADGYDITMERIVENCPEGDHAIRTALRELETAGYLKRVRTPIITGGSTVEYILMDPRSGGSPTPGEVPKPHPRPDQPKQPVFAAQPSMAETAPSFLTQEDQEEDHTPSVCRPKPKSRATSLPDDFKITDEMKGWSRTNCPAVADHWAETEAFLDYHRSKGSTFKDWSAAWRTWMRNAQRFAQRAVPASRYGQSTPNHLRSTTDEKVAQTLALADKYDRLDGKAPRQPVLELTNGSW